MANLYETMLITSTTLDEEASAALISKFTKLIEKNGEIVKVDDWGKKRLAYPIQDETEGVYTLITFKCEAGFIAELERVYGITDGVLRSMVIATQNDKKANAAKESEG